MNLKKIKPQNLVAVYQGEIWGIVTIYLATQMVVIESNDNEQKEVSLGEVDICLPLDLI